MGAPQHGVRDVTAALEPYDMQQADQYHLHCTSSIFRIEAQDGFVIVGSAERVKPGDEVAFQYDGYPTIGILFSSGLIMPNGETMEGGVRERIIVLGKASATILDDDEPYMPTI
ncbi:MAG: phage repressor protein [Pantoea sp.]|nr:phage repressor protein [Pantoea sp.]